MKLGFHAFTWWDAYVFCLDLTQKPLVLTWDQFMVTLRASFYPYRYHERMEEKW